MKSIFLGWIFFFMIFKFAIDYTALSSISQLEIYAELPKGSHFTIYYQNGITNRSYNDNYKFTSKKTEKTALQKNIIEFNNFIAKKIRIDIFSNSSSAKIYGVTIRSNFAAPIQYGPGDLYKRLSLESGSVFSISEDYFEVATSNAKRAQLELIHPSDFTNYFFSLILPAFLATTFCLAFKCISLDRIHAISDITNKKPSSQQNITALDGLRGFAALLVLANHTNYPYFKGLGGIGVWLFFVLSGFLLATPFIKNPGMIFSLQKIRNYFFRRFARILPMYYFMLVVNYLSIADVYTFTRHALFLQGDSILWTIPQEMYFYMLLPFLLLINCFLQQIHKYLPVFFTLLLVIVFNHLNLLNFVFYYGNGQKMYLWLGIFLTGVLLSYLYHFVFNIFEPRTPVMIWNILGITLIVIILFSSEGSIELLTGRRLSLPFTYPQIYGYISGILLLTAVMHHSSLTNKIMSWYPLRAIGVVGFSFYLLHTKFIELVRFLSSHLTGNEIEGIPLLIVAGLLTYIASIFTYSLIEKPFMSISFKEC